jgi:hypothetical protein
VRARDTAEAPDAVSLALLASCFLRYIGCSPEPRRETSAYIALPRSARMRFAHAAIVSGAFRQDYGIRL